MLRKQRQIKGMSQSQLSNKSSVNLRMIQKYEAGNKHLSRARLDTLLKLCNTLECKLSDLIDDPELKSLINVYHANLRR